MKARWTSEQLEELKKRTGVKIVDPGPATLVGLQGGVKEIRDVVSGKVTIRPDEPEKPKRPNKFHNIPVIIDGIWFQSTFEGQYYGRLKMLQMAGELTFKRQVRYNLIVNGQHITKYIADFVVTYPDGRVEVVDTKGVVTPEFRIKRKLMLACKGIEIKEVYRNGK